MKINKEINNNIFFQTTLSRQKKRYTWTQLNPLIRRHLNYWFVSTDIQEDVTKTSIIPAIKVTEHSAITLALNSIIIGNLTLVF